MAEATQQRLEEPLSRNVVVDDEDWKSHVCLLNRGATFARKGSIYNAFRAGKIGVLFRVV
jgi:hypothetical protein